MLPSILQLQTLENQSAAPQAIGDGYAGTGGTETYELGGIMTCKEVLPAEFKLNGELDGSKVSALSAWLLLTYNAGKEVRQKILNRINRNEELYRNRPTKAVNKKPYKNAAAHHIPIVGPRLSQRKSACHQTISGAERLFYLQKLGDTQRADDVENDLDFLLKASCFTETLRDILDTNMPCNQSVLLVEFTSDPNGVTYANHIGPYAGFKFEPIHPENFVTYPASHPDLMRASFAGHEFEMRRAEVELKQHQKLWFDQAVISHVHTLRSQSGATNLQSDSLTGTLKDQPVILVDSLIRYRVEGEKVEKVYRVKFDSLTGVPYRIEPYEKPFSHYVTYRFYKNLTAYWSEDSPANDGQSLNLAINDLFNNILWGVAYAARQAILMRGVPGQDSLKNIEPGAAIPVANLAETAPLQSNVQLSGMDFVIQVLLQLADGAMKVPDTITGQRPNAKNETATAQNYKFTGFQLSGSEDVAALVPALRETAKICLWLMYENWDAIASVYGDSLKTQQAAMFVQPGLAISIAGREPAALPEVQQAQITKLLEIFSGIQELHPLILPLILKFVNQSSVEGKEDLTQSIAQMIKVMQMSPEELMEAAQQEGIPVQGGAGEIPSNAAGTPVVQQAPEATPVPI